MIKLNKIYPPKCNKNGGGGDEDKENNNEDVDVSDEQYEVIKKNYGNKLAQHCKDNDCEFIKYDTKQGIWEFSVRHFTIYGLPGAKAPKQSKAKKQKQQLPQPMQQVPIVSNLNENQSQSPLPKRHDSQASIQYSQINNSMLQQSQYNNKVGLNELKNRDIADSFSALINNAPRQPNQMLVDENVNTINNKYGAHTQMDDEQTDDESIYDTIDDTHEEIPYDTIIFHENIICNKEDKKEEKEKENKEKEQSCGEYYPKSMILKNPNPITYSSEIAKQFEHALKCELDLVLKQSASNKYNKQQELKQNDNENDFMMNGNGFGLNRNQSLSDFQRLENDRKMNWESYDLGFRNKGMCSTLIRNGTLYGVMNRQYFQKDQIAFFHPLKESNKIQTHSVVTGLEKVLGKQIYLELINKLLMIHKQYYLDKKMEWDSMDSGDKLQDLTDSYCQQIKYMLSFVQNKENNKMVLGKTILTKFYDAFQLILALYAPRCGSGDQSNLKIPAKEHISHIIHDNSNHNNNMMVSDDEYEYDSDDRKMMDKNDNNHHNNVSYNELFARKINISKWLESAIAEEVNHDLNHIDKEIEKIKNGMFDLNENQDEKHEEINNVNDIEKKVEINRWIDEKIFIMLTANRKLEACELALESGNYKLASLISQSSHFAASNESYQPFLDLRNQIDYWKKHKIWKTFNHSKKKIYALLAGRYVEIVSEANFNWFRCFGVILWYYLPIHWNLNECISYYNSMCKIKEYPFTLPILNIKNNCKDIQKLIKIKQNEIINEKNPLHIKSNSLFTKTELKDKFPNDICFDLLQMKCSNYDFDIFENIFNPRNIQPFKLEYLFNWFIHNLLFETQHIHIRNNKQMETSSNIYHSFIEQLERMGYWHWAIYLCHYYNNNNPLKQWLKYDYNDIAYLILRRNINKSIPLGFNAKFIKETKHLNDITFNDLVKNNKNNKKNSDKTEMDVDDIKNNNNNNNTSNNTDEIHYKYCDKSEKFYTEYLKQFWINILDETIINGLKFLVHIDIKMEQWITYCLAEYAESRQQWIIAFLSYTKCLKYNEMHEILMNHLFVDWLFEDKINKLISTLNELEMNKNRINNWNGNGMILLHYIKLMRDIQNNPNQNIDINLNRIQKVKQGINKMLENLNNDNIDTSEEYENEYEYDSDEQQNENENDLKKRVCLMTMEQRLDTCVVHLTQNK